MKQKINKKGILLMLLLLATFILSGCMMTPPDEVAGLDNQGVGQGIIAYATPTPSPTPTPTPEPTATPTPKPSEGMGLTGADIFNPGNQTGQVAPTDQSGLINILPTKSPISTTQILPTSTQTTIATATQRPTATPAPTAGSLKEGSSGQNVKSLQQQLKNLGYYTGSVDGVFGAGTTNAVKEFQKVNGLNADGKAGKYTLDKIKSSTAKKKPTATAKVTAKPTAKVTATPRPTATPNLTKETYFRIGDSGKSVSQLQDRLIQLGYLTGTSDGKFDSRTDEAIKAFQKRSGLWDDGVAGPDTQRALYSQGAKKANNAVAHIGTLRPGDKNDGVRSMQKELALLGYLKSSQADGAYGDTTKSAVTHFQRMNNLSPIDGIAGGKTLEKLYSGSAIRSDGTGGNGNVDDTPSSEGYVTLRPGTKGQQVKNAQQKLKDFGYYSGSVDGSYGSGTAEAVSVFQFFNGLKVDGIAGVATQRLMFGQTANNPLKYSPLRPYSEGKAVRTMQTTLSELGYYYGTVNGIYGESTVQAVKDFQGNNNLKADGTAGADTLGLMYSSFARPKGSSGSTYETLRIGSQGGAVTDVQSKLQDLGYLSSSVTITGVYDQLTANAVKEFQQKNGLKQDGVAGEGTQRLLFHGNPRPK